MDVVDVEDVIARVGQMINERLPVAVPADFDQRKAFLVSLIGDAWLAARPIIRLARSSEVRELNHRLLRASTRILQHDLNRLSSNERQGAIALLSASTSLQAIEEFHESALVAGATVTDVMTEAILAATRNQSLPNM